MIETPMKNPNTHPGQGMAEIRAKTGKERAWEKKSVQRAGKGARKQNRCLKTDNITAYLGTCHPHPEMQRQAEEEGFF